MYTYTLLKASFMNKRNIHVLWDLSAQKTLMSDFHIGKLTYFELTRIPYTFSG